MLRTLGDEGSDRDITFIHYARTPEEACYRAELAAMPGVRVLHGYSRSAEAGDLTGYFGRRAPARHAAPDAVFVCGPPALVEAVRAHFPDAQLRELRPAGVRDPGRGVGRAGSPSPTAASTSPTTAARCSSRPRRPACQPESGCRMGICHTCTRRKTSGAVKNLITGAVSTADEEDVQICVSVPVGDVELAL